MAKKSRKPAKQASKGESAGRAKRMAEDKAFSKKVKDEIDSLKKMSRSKRATELAKSDNRLRSAGVSKRIRDNLLGAQSIAVGGPSPRRIRKTAKIRQKLGKAMRSATSSSRKAAEKKMGKRKKKR
jgi:hypothetical protein